MRIVSGSTFFLASLAITGAYGAPTVAKSTQSDLPASSSFVGGSRIVPNPANPNEFVAVESLAAGAALSPRPSRLMNGIIKPVEHIPCGLGVAPPHHLPPGYLVDCPELNSRIFGAVRPQQTEPSLVEHAPRELPAPTLAPEDDRSSYPPTEPSSFYELDPTILPPDTTTYPPIIPVISATTIPGGATITNFIGHLSIVLDNPPTSTPEPTRSALQGE